MCYRSWEREETTQHGIACSQGFFQGLFSEVWNRDGHEARADAFTRRHAQGVVELLADHTVCRDGETLSANQAAVLRIFDVKMAAFRLRLLACWHADGAPPPCLPQEAAWCLCACMGPERGRFACASVYRQACVLAPVSVSQDGG